MVRTVSREYIEHVYTLLETRGPASAYDYVERTGCTMIVPLHLLRMLRLRLQSPRSKQRAPRQKRVSGR